MDWLKILLKLVKEFLPFFFMYNAGKKSKELNQVKDENKKLKEYKRIDDKEIQVSEVYDEKAWK